MTAPRFLLAYDDLVQQADTVSCSQALSSLPAANLTDPRLSKVMRSSSTAADMIVEWSDLVPIRFVALLGHNLIAGPGEDDYVINITLKDGGSGGTTILNTGSSLQPWQPPVGGFARHWYYELDDVYEADYASITIVHISNPDGYVELGRLWLGDYWQPTEGINRQWTMNVVDPSKIDRSRGAQMYADRLTKYRSLQIDLNQVPFGEAFGDSAAPDAPNLLKFNFVVGRSSSLICIARKDDEWSRHVTGVYGHITENSGLRHRKGDRYSQSFTITEAL